MGGLFDPGKQFPRSVPGGWAGLVSAQSAQKRAAPLDLEQEVQHGIAPLLLQQVQLALRQQAPLHDLRPQSLVVNSLAEVGKVVGDCLFVFLIHLAGLMSCLASLV